MKSFRQFISEALETIASSQAKQMGLQGNGHGDWYDTQGNLVAKTVKGKLKIFSGRGGKGPKSSPKPEEKSVGNIDQKNISKEVQDQEIEQNGISKGVVVVLGRFNPPAKNHEQMLKYGMARASESGYEYRIYPSRIQDEGTNPLNPSLKIQYMSIMYPEFVDYIIDSEDMKNLFDVLQSLYSEGYRDVKVVVGSERVGEFQSLAHRNQGQAYEFENIEVLPSPGKDPDSDTSGVGSSAALKTAAMNGDFAQFSASLPKKMKRKDQEDFFNSVTKSMKISESTQLWKVVPELDMNGLRINYKKNNLYPLGSIVENLNTGIRGRVIRRGTNHLICVTEDGFMFKSWLQNVREAVYEVGTDKYREYYQQITPGETVRSFTGIPVKETNPKKLNINRKKIKK
jgi:hypothetical protein